jgi:hypothetical protein
MRAHPASRASVAVAGLAAAYCADGPQVALCAAFIAIGFLAGGEARTALRLAAILAPLFIVSAILWSIVLARQGELLASPLALIVPGSRFLTMSRALVGSSAMILGFATAPDGELYLVFRQLGVPRNAAATVTTGATLAAAISDSFGRAHAALRAQGIVGTGALSSLIRLSDVLSVTWVSGLNNTISRAECKWAGNQFLDNLAPPPLLSRGALHFGTIVLSVTTLLLTATLLAKTHVDHLL